MGEMTYCDIAPALDHHREYHASEYGFPLRDDDQLFERLMLEINQAGLSWLTILKKRDAFRTAFDGFHVEKVARYGERQRRRLLADPGIVRNRLKIDAAIANARRILQLRKEHGSFAEWLDGHHPRQKEEWVKLFRNTFVFTGGEITGEFLLSTGYLPGAHQPQCPVYTRVVEAGAPWTKVKSGIQNSEFRMENEE